MTDEPGVQSQLPAVAACGYKMAAKMGPRYLEALEENEDVVAQERDRKPV